jgi:chromosome segregation ATPase
LPDSNAIDKMPPIVPSRDEVASRSRGGGAPRGGKSGNGGGGTGLWARLFIVVALVVAAVACAWAWQLQQALDAADRQLNGYAQRIADLEDRLSDTDEGMSQSSAAMAVKIRELYSEVDKLWAQRNLHKKNLAELEARDKQLGSADSKADRALVALKEDLGKLATVADDLERLLANAKTNASQLERLADDVNRLTLEAARLNKRVTANEEWVESINGFRRQVNATLSQLQAGTGG